MASFTCLVFCLTKRLRLERIVRAQLLRWQAVMAPADHLTDQLITPEQLPAVAKARIDQKGSRPLWMKLTNASGCARKPAQACHQNRAIGLLGNGVDIALIEG